MPSNTADFCGDVACDVAACCTQRTARRLTLVCRGWMVALEADAEVGALLVAEDESRLRRYQWRRRDYEDFATSKRAPRSASSSATTELNPLLMDRFLQFYVKQLAFRGRRHATVLCDLAPHAAGSPPSLLACQLLARTLVLPPPPPSACLVETIRLVCTERTSAEEVESFFADPEVAARCEALTLHRTGNSSVTRSAASPSSKAMLVQPAAPWRLAHCSAEAAGQLRSASVSRCDRTDDAAIGNFFGRLPALE